MCVPRTPPSRDLAWQVNNNLQRALPRAAAPPTEVHAATTIEVILAGVQHPAAHG